MTRKLGKGAVALVTALTIATPAALVPNAAVAYVFNDVRIQGTQRIEPATVLSYANIARGQNVSAGELNDALQRLQNSGLFETVEIVPQGGTLIITVSEYPTINQISFEGNRRLKDDELAQIAQSQSRRVYQPSQAIQDAQNIAQAYASRGRLAARVDPRIIRRSGNRVDLVFEIREGDVTEIERISFTGNRAFSDRRLRQVLETKQAGILRTFIRADTFAPERIPLDEQLLTDFYRSRGYADFKVQGVAPEIARERDAFYITFNIQEGPRYRFRNVSTISEIAGVDAAPFAAQNRVGGGDVYNPAAIDVDPKGRVWVAEAINYRKWGGRNPGVDHPEGDRVVILEDTDGDGSADSSKVFVQDADLTAPLGICVVPPRVYVSCSPHIFVYTDEDGDDVPDKRETFLTGFGGFDHDHGVHSVVAGDDGWLYIAAGNAGPHIVTGSDGATVRSGSIYTGGSPYNGRNSPGLVSDDGMDWTAGIMLRVRPDGTGLHVFADNFRACARIWERGLLGFFFSLLTSSLIGFTHH